jgi:hypothetical protein
MAQPRDTKPERPSLTPEWKGDHTEDEHLYDPDEITASRMREQGLGMGSEELRLQRDPTGATTTREERQRSETASELEVEDKDWKEGKRDVPPPPLGR